MTDTTLIKTPLTELTGVTHPVVQTAMGWVSDEDLVVATAQAGGLGFIASAMMSTEELESSIRKVKERTDRPFGVNLRADASDAEDRADLLIKHGVKVAGFALAPKRELIAKLKNHGVVVIPSVGAPRHAQKVAEWGADMVMVAGGEAGGHTGKIPTSLLVPAVIDAVDIPVIAAGGYFDGRGLASALSYGAVGVGMGTRFLVTQECNVPDPVKQLFLEADLNATAVTTKFDGMPLRALLVGLAKELEDQGDQAKGTGFKLGNVLALKKESGTSWWRLMRDGLEMRKQGGRDLQQLMQAANTPIMMRDGLAGDVDHGVISSGQVAGMITDIPTCAELIERVVAQAVQQINSLHALQTPPATSD